MQLLHNIGNYLEKIVFTTNWITSKFGTRWDICTLWILFVGIVTAFYMNNSLIVDLFEVDNFHKFLNFIKNTNKEVFKYISILADKDTFKNEPIAFFMNEISLGYLYYQFVISIRKDTRK